MSLVTDLPKPKQSFNIVGTVLYISEEDSRYMVDSETCYLLKTMVDLEDLLACIREQDPALYMKGITTDMLREYT